MKARFNFPMQKRLEKISVLLTTKDRPRLLHACLNSIAKQTRRPDEVVIVDASNNSQRIIVERFKNLLDVQYLHRPGYNCARARNQCIKMAKNKLLLLTDDDCIAEKYWIEKMLQLYREYPNAVAISGEIVHVPRDSLYADIITHVRSHRREIAKKVSKIVYINSDNCLFRKDKLLEFNIQFDERMVREEDTDIVLQIQSKGGEVVMEKGGKVYHHARPNLWEFLKQRFINSGNVPRLSKKWSMETFHFYGSQRTRYGDLFIEYMKNLYKRGGSLKLIQFVSIIFLSVVFYEVGQLYYRLRYQRIIF